MGTKADWLRGIFPALVTPFTAAGALDESALRALIRRLLPDVDGLVPGGTTGEFSSMDLDERRRLIAICLDEVDGRVPVLAGTGCPGTRETLALTAWARDAGADGALVVAPYYLKPAFNEVYDHYRAVDGVGLPFVMYNIPQCAGTHLRWWTAEGGLLDFVHAVGLKDSSGDLAFLAALLEKVRGRVALLVGHDEVVQPALAAGCDGAILGSANLIPGLWRQLHQAVQAGDLAAAQGLQQRAQKLARIVARGAPPQACKEGLRMLGLDVGRARHPLVPGGAFRREDREELRLQLEDLGQIVPRAVTFDTGERQVVSNVPAVPDTPAAITGFTLRVGEGFAGPPLQELAHVDLLLGRGEGPVGRAIARAVDEPSGKQGLAVVLVRPRVLLVPTITIRSDKQRRLFAAAGRGVVRAIEQCIADGFLPEPLLDDLVLIVNAFVHSAASIERRVEGNNMKATRHALRKALEGRPTVGELIAERSAARHPFRYAP